MNIIIVFFRWISCLPSPFAEQFIFSLIMYVSVSFLNSLVGLACINFWNLNYLLLAYLSVFMTVTGYLYHSVSVVLFEARSCSTSSMVLTPYDCFGYSSPFVGSYEFLYCFF